MNGTARTRATTLAALAVAAMAALTLGACGADSSTESATDAAAAPAVGGQSGGDTAAVDADGQPPADGKAGQAGSGSSGSRLPAITPASRAVVHTVDLVIRADDVRAATATAQQRVVAAGGFVADESTTVDPDDPAQTTARIVLRVPVDEHNAVVTELERLGTVVSRSRAAKDVTDEVVDVNSRVESQRRSIARIRDLLQRAQTLQEVLALEGDLARREADLDSLLRRQAQLESLTQLATVTLTVTSTAAEPEDEDQSGFLAGLRQGWDAFVTALTVVITGLGAVLPFALTLAVLGLPLWLLWRSRARRRTPPAPNPAPNPAPEP